MYLLFGTSKPTYIFLFSFDSIQDFYGQAYRRDRTQIRLLQIDTFSVVFLSDCLSINSEKVSYGAQLLSRFVALHFSGTLVAPLNKSKDLNNSSSSHTLRTIVCLFCALNTLVMCYALSFLPFVIDLVTPLPGNPTTFFYFFCVTDFVALSSD